MDCAFCKIIAGEIPSKKLYEDDMVYAFYDIEPAAPVHFLVVPKEHVLESCAQVQEEHAALIGHIFHVIAQLGPPLDLGGGCRGGGHCGGGAGRAGQHLHFHVLGGGPLGAMA